MTDTKSLSIKNWSNDDKPREKLMAKGINTLSNAELLAIIIGSGSRDESAVELSKRILNQHANNLNTLGKLGIEDLIKFKGIGEAKAISIVAAMELGRRRKNTEIQSSPKISSSSDIFEIFHPILADVPHEEFWIVLLNRSNKVIEKYRISQGGISGTVTDIRLILKMALDKLSSAIILCHNHPSGNLKPSEADISITKKVKESAALMEINVLDHIIIAESGYFSFADDGIL